MERVGLKPAGTSSAQAETLELAPLRGPERIDLEQVPIGERPSEGLPSRQAALIAQLRILLGTENLAALMGLAAGRSGKQGAPLAPAATVNAAERGQVSKSAADVYEEFFVPALFGEWAAPSATAAKIKRGDAVLDVACGTGVVARHAADLVGRKGSVVGFDINEGMLEVARRKEPSIDWRQGRAEALPFADASFDAATNQFGLMFFENRAEALSEMMRVVKPGGHISVTVWDSLPTSPGYQAMTNLLDRLFGAEVADALRAPFVLGDVGELRSIFREAGIENVEIETRRGTARFPSLEAWIHTDVKGWTLRELIDDAQYARLLEAAKTDLAQYVKADGSVEFDAPGHVITAVKPD